jgi:hypothetical protein
MQATPSLLLEIGYENHILFLNPAQTDEPFTIS